jgi:protein SCO1/2
MAGAAAATPLLRPLPANARTFNAIPDVTVQGHDGRSSRFDTDLVRDRIVTINFFFVSCGEIRPRIMANLREVQALLGPRVGRDIFMYSVTLFPELETAEDLRHYAELMEIAPGWLLLTGAPDDIEHLRRSLGFYRSDPEEDLIKDEHTGLLRYGNDRLQRWAGGPALGRPEWIVKAIATGLLPYGESWPELTHLTDPT